MIIPDFFETGLIIYKRTEDLVPKNLLNVVSDQISLAQKEGVTMIGISAWMKCPRCHDHEEFDAAILIPEHSFEIGDRATTLSAQILEKIQRVLNSHDGENCLSNYKKLYDHFMKENTHDIDL